MKKITAEQIRNLNISPSECVQWVKDSFKMKYDCQCPAKISVHPHNNDFITTMPALLPEETHTFGVKVVSRVNGRHPALHSDLTLYDTVNGNIKAIVDANWITSMRTGAVVALTIETFRKTNANHISMIGLGNTAHASLTCILDYFKDEHFEVRLMRYKDQAEKFIEDFKAYSNVTFSIVDSIQEFAKDAEIIISCITDAQGLLIEDNDLFMPGVLVIPVHTRGFQNCDLFFDKVFADDTDHVKGFKYFDKFRRFDELSHVLLKANPGRENDQERILAYNIGLGLHDVLFAYRIYHLLDK